MAGEDLDLDETGSEDGKKGKHKPLTKGQKIGIGIGVVTILLIIYQVRKQSAANAAASSSGSAAVDPLTGYPSGSPQDQQALASMYSGSASTGSYPGSGGGGGGGVVGGDGGASALANYLGSLPSTNPLSPNYTGPTDTFTANPSPTPTINVNVPAPTVVTNPVATTAANGGASTTHDGSPAANTLEQIVNAIDPNHTTVVIGGHTYYGIGNNPALTSISTAAHQQGVSYQQTNAKALGLPGGKATAQYIG